MAFGQANMYISINYLHFTFYILEYTHLLPFLLLICMLPATDFVCSVVIIVLFYVLCFYSILFLFYLNGGLLMIRQTGQFDIHHTENPHIPYGIIIISITSVIIDSIIPTMISHYNILMILEQDGIPYYYVPTQHYV